MEAELVSWGRKLLHDGLTVGTWGNLSMRDPDSGYIYLTPSGMDYDICTADDIVVCKADGETVEGTRRPTIEKDMHLAVYRARQDINAIVHTHPIYSTVFSCAGQGIPPVTDAAAQTFGAEVPVCDYALPGSDELARVCAEAVSCGVNACLLKAHGAVCLGKDMKSAFAAARVLEITAEILWRIRAMGAECAPIDEKDIAFMRGELKEKYGQRGTAK